MVHGLDKVVAVLCPNPYGKSEIYLSFNLLEKCFKKEEIVKSQLPRDEKDGLMRLIQGAHAEAQKIVKLAQDSHDKLVKIAENKSAGIEEDRHFKGRIVQV